jgi:hypothetical protein
LNPLVYFIADLYPWWGIPLAFILAEVANGYRRRGDRKKMVLWLIPAFVLMSIAGAYFLYNGFEKLRPAMEHFERAMNNK